MYTRPRVLPAIAAALLSGSASLIAPRASASDLIVKADEFTLVGVPWWHHGYIEAGARGFLNNPQRDGIRALGGESLAKYYEYSTIQPGPFLNGWAATGSKDGLYQVDTWAENVGYSDQQYGLEASNPADTISALAGISCHTCTAPAHERSTMAWGRRV